MNSITLSELSSRIQDAIRLNFEAPVWIRAEISELRENPNGHCYLELVEKDSTSDTLVAKSKATIWSGTYRMLKPYFESSTGQQLKAGLKVLVAVSVDFHGLYGFSLNIRDIDPVFTVGEMAARRLQIVKQLEADGIIDMNRQLDWPKLPQRLAVISSPTAAGYGDFCDQLHHNPAGFRFYTQLFAAVMQGDAAEGSIVSALEQIYEKVDCFDAVVIIRGGGAVTDLACFDSYELAANCAQFPLPVVAGIGHQRDVSVLDMVVARSLKTPTAVAEHLIACLQEAENEVVSLLQSIRLEVKSRILAEEKRVEDVKWRIKSSLQSKVSVKKRLLEKQQGCLRTAVRMALTYQKNKLAMMEKSIEIHSPAFLLKHGYTLTTINGKRMTSVHQAKKGDSIRTYLNDGSLQSVIDEITILTIDKRK